MIFPTISEQGYFIRPGNSSSATGNHRFCGKHDIAGAQCPNCSKPLLRFFTFDLRDLPFRIQSTIPIVHLLFCWECNVAQYPFTYQMLSENEIQILKYRPGKEADNFPYENYPDYFPEASVEFIPLQEEEQRLIRLINNEEISIYLYENGKYDYLNMPDHQIGGMPKIEQVDYWQNWLIKPCPLCGDQMQFFAEIGDSCLDKRGFVNDAYVQVLYTYCKKCQVFTAQVACT